MRALLLAGRSQEITAVPTADWLQQVASLTADWLQHVASLTADWLQQVTGLPQECLSDEGP